MSKPGMLSQGKTFEITVTGLDGNSLRLKANIYFKVSEHKRNIQQKWTIPVSQQRLVFTGTILDDSKTLLDAMIFFDAMIITPFLPSPSII